ncbi:Soraphen polyketide synthase A, related, related [Eimeria acervulina]|uniref:Soraphen polyketide synthase A, related, related n=1 Tax=Eimeria acervulina TaxID=5801 RepID=U6G9D5_EIMAC|nr:Soraphen polyketide synthase A, related, related [Eimeria acervulina]CDI76871.1 Soraphen polyketide synthase A, related, related [Eimeria acervulina]
MGISNELGARVLMDVLKNPQQAVVCAQALMWRKFLRRYAFDPPPFFSDVSTVTAVTFSTMIDLNSISKEALVEILVDVAQAVSGSTTKPNAATPLIDLGLDSLGAVEFRNSVAEKTGVKLPQNLMFENPSVEDIAEYILNRARSPEGASGSRGTLADTLQMTIDQWLMSVLVPAERYALYVDSLTASYGSLSEMASVEDIVSALERLEVSVSEDFDRLNVAWEELRDAYASRSEATTAVKRKPRLAVRVPHPTEDVESLINQLTFDVQTLEPPTSPENYRTAMLTGATGFVGRIQLSVLLEATRELEVVCIVRAKDADHALDRIRQACKEAKCWKEEYCSRIHPIPGDFTLPNLGLEEEQMEELSRKVDVVYHTGGDVNLLSNYARLRSSNVLCILGIVNFCTRHRLKPLHFASTLGQFPAFFCEFTGAYRDYRITEDSRPTVEEMEAFYPPLRMGYPWSKWAAELVLCSARDKGLPVFLYRLPNTYVAYSTGYTNRTDYATALMVSTIQEGIFPVGCAAAPLTPVDIICEMLVGVSLLEKPKHFVYHLFDPRAITREHLEVWSQELGLAYKGASVDEFLAAVKARGPESPVFKFVPLMQFMRKYWFDSEQRTDDFPIENKNIFEDLPDAKWPDQRDIFKNSLLYSVQSGFFPKNSKAIRVDPEACLEDAKRMSGLDSLGEDHDYFMKPLHILKDSLLQESNPSFCGKLAMFRTVRQQLMNLMYMEKMRIEHPEIEQQEIKEPLIIVGLNRTGTTFLQNIMATDISNRSARYCEMIAPYGNNGDYCQKGLSNDPESWKHDPRIKFAQEVLDSQLALSEEWISIHAQSAELPEEDFVMLEHCGRCYSICTEFNVPSYRKWLYANDFQEMKNAYRFHKRFLQHLQYQRVADRWLLKMPFHLFTLDALFETYPDARIIFMHRDPKDTLASWASLVRCAQQSLLDSVNPTELGKLELEAMSSMINQALDFRASRPDLKDQILDVQYKDLIENPLGTVSKIYSHFKIPLTEQARLRMTEFCQEDKKTRNKLSKHQYTLEDVSLTKAMVEKAFGQYYNSGLCKYLKK